MADPKLSITLGAKDEASPEVRKLKGELETLGRIKSFQQLKLDTAAAEKEWRAAQKRVAELAREMREGGSATGKLSKAFETAKRDAGRLKQAYIDNRDGLQAMRKELTSAGVDTRKLGEAQKRLQKSTKDTRELLLARSKLGVAPYRDVRAEIGQLRSAYDTLRKSGTLTTSELIRAKQNLRAKTAELKAETGGWAAAITRAHGGLLALAGAGYGVVRSFQQFSQFEQRMGEVNTLIDASGERFGQLRGQILELTRAIPQSASELAAAEYDILSAGVSLEKSVQTLALSGKAAVAGLTDTKTAAGTGIGVVNAYGKSIDDLDEVYDILFQTIKSGVTTFPQLSQSIGEVLPTAKAADVQFQDVAAAIATMTKAGIKTPQATTALKGAINALAAPAPEAKKQFEALGITWQGLIPTLDQIRAKGLSIDQMRLLIPDVEARTGVLALTQNFESLEEILGEMDGAAGAMEEAYDKMKDTPENQVKLLQNAFDEVLLSAGALAAKGFIPLSKAIRFVFDGIREMGTPTKIFIGTMLTAGVAFKLWKMGMGDIVLGLADMIRKMGLAGAAATSMSSAWQAAGLGMRLAFVGVAAFTAVKLVQLGKAVYEAKKAGDAARESAERAAEANDKAVNSLARWKDVRVPDDIAGRAPEELERLRGELFRAKLYYQQLIEQMERTGDKKGLAEARRRLAEVKDGLDEVGRAAAGAAEDMEKPAEAVKATVEQLSEFEQKVKAAYEEAKSAAQKYADKVVEIEEKIKNARLDAEDRIREIGRKAMTDEQAWADRQVQADEKLYQAREALRQQDYDTAERLFKQQMDLATGLAEEVTRESADGQKQVVKSLEETVKVAQDKYREGAEGIQEVYKAQQEAAKKGQEQELSRMALLKAMMEELAQKRLAEVEIELTNLQAMEQRLNEFVNRPREAHVYVTTHHRTVEEHAAGGMAGGFSRLAGKLPGYGGGDRIRALLEAGEFIVRKEAVQKYGAGLFAALNNLRMPSFDMAGMVRAQIGGLVDNLPRFAAGGPVMPEERMVIELAAGGVSLPLTVAGPRASTRAGVRALEQELRKMRLSHR